MNSAESYQESSDSLRRIREQLTGPGGQFEVVTETISGIKMKAYKDRFSGLREVAAFGALHGDKEFLVFGDRRITFREFLAEANSVSQVLTDQSGVTHGDRVAVLAQNSPEWCLAFWGTVNLGAVLVGLNGWWTTEELMYGLEDSGAKVLVADRKRFERIADQVHELANLEHVYLIDAGPEEFAVQGERGPQLHTFSELTAQPSDAFPAVPIQESDPAVIFYTSGTTGKPKGAISSHRSMIANLQNTACVSTASVMHLSRRVLEETVVEETVLDETVLDETAPTSKAPAQMVALFTAPLFHVAGCHSTMVVGMLAGVKLVMLEGKFEPVKALTLIERERVTMWSGVPTMVWRVCEYPDRHDFDTSSVTNVSFGGSPSADELLRRIRETFPGVRTTTNAYGLTESSSAATTLSGADAFLKPDSVGLAMPTVDIAILGSHGEHLPPLQTGEVLLRGPIIMPGYWNKPEATATTVIDGWLHTGDVGHLDSEGYLFITDRAKDMIIRGGENIYCVEIENRLVEHVAIADAAIISVPHETLGEEVKAVLEIVDGANVTDDEIREWVAASLAGFKVPTYIERSDGKLPRNASGKLLKNVLRGEGHVSFSETM
jgi:long-chain acyl-CoA synthetase